VSYSAKPSRTVILTCVLASAALGGCGGEAATDGSSNPGDLGGPGDAGNETAPLRYEEGSQWACRPDRDDDLCLTADLTRTSVGADGSFVSVEHEPAAEPKFDCFYVYPTVNEATEPGNTTNLSDPGIGAAVVSQAAWFRSLCSVYAPLYRQMSVGSYDEVFPEGQFWESGEPFAVAYADVSAAFDHYLTHDNQGRDFVLIGHSQGAHLLTRLLLDRFEHDEDMRKRLISALLVGPLGRVVVPASDDAAGTFDNLPLCTAGDQTGCVVAFDGVAAGVDLDLEQVDALAPGTKRACTNPAALGGGKGTLREAIWHTADVPLAPAEVVDPWLSYPAYYSAECASDGDLEISPVEDDPRLPVGDPQHLQQVIAQQYGTTSLGLHVVDFNLSIGDLLRVVERQGAAR
jgi:pimeloyl-ACP methyl ester carboxylesterase